MSRLFRRLLPVIVPFIMAAPLAAAVPDDDPEGTLGNLWETVLETPTPQNPFAGGSPCVDLGPVVAPLAPFAPSITCTVKPTESLFIAAMSSECSTFEAGTPFGGANEAELRECVRVVNSGLAPPTVTVDGSPVPVSEVESDLLLIHLPKDNIFGTSKRQGQSVARGWVVSLGRLSPGSHQVVIHVVGSYLGEAVDFTNSTTIIVTKS